MRSTALLYPALIAASFVLSACERAAIDSSQSLVGADRIPSSGELSRETIEVNRGFGESSNGLLVYELTPDNRLTVSVENTTNNENAVRIATKDVFKIPGVTAERARRALWRLRPEKTNGLAEEARPLGCTRQFDHDWGALAVIFVAPDPHAEFKNKLRVFVLPDPESCGTKAATEARMIVRNVIAAFPPSRVAKEFDRQTDGAWALTTSAP